MVHCHGRGRSQKSCTDFVQTIEGAKKGAFRALFVPFFPLAMKAAASCSAMRDPPAALEKKTSATAAA
jgi:hypothetical protein